MLEIPDDQKHFAKTLRENLPFYSEKYLKIQPKQGGYVSLKYNKAQQFIHDSLERQRKLFGRVRVMLLKGRQEGATTYVESRFYHKLTWDFGLSAFTLSHLSSTTDELYGKVELFHQESPEPKPELERAANKRHIKFADIGSKWDFGTAGSDKVGRGGTLQLFHGSEVAFWPHPEKIEAGIMQSVADMDGTEIILESTANGMDPVFYRKCMESMRHEGDFEMVFVPWFWMDEYRRKVTGEFQRTEEEETLVKLYGLDDEQLNWRRFKIIDLGGKWKFKQEYPCTPIEAFQVSGESFISPEDVVAARQLVIPKDEYSFAPLIASLDPSLTRDRAVFTFRRGRRLLKTFIFNPKKGTISDGKSVIGSCDRRLDPMKMAGTCASFIKQYQPDKFYIDLGEGQGIVSRLHELGYRKIVRGVLFHEQADNPLRFANKRAEMWWRLKEWISCEDGTVQVPDNDALQADLCSMPIPENTSNARIKMPDKDIIKRKLGFSPDIGDAVALTFAFLINSTHHENANKIKKLNPEKSGLRTLQKKRTGNPADFAPGNIFAR